MGHNTAKPIFMFDHTYICSDVASESYVHSYSIFCEKVIEKKIMREKEIYRLNTLARKFRKLVNKHEDPSLLNYRYLKLAMLK